MTEAKRSSEGEEGGPVVPTPPSIVALLRMTWQRAREHIQKAVRDAGFDDLQDAHIVVFASPTPDAVRPSDLARHMGMSRQATNYLIGQLEALGYLERRSDPESGSDRRRVYLTERGRAVFEVVSGAMQRLQVGWEAEIGQERMRIFVETLALLSAWAPSAA